MTGKQRDRLVQQLQDWGEFYLSENLVAIEYERATKVVKLRSMHGIARYEDLIDENGIMTYSEERADELLH